MDCCYNVGNTQGRFYSLFNGDYAKQIIMLQRKMKIPIKLGTSQGTGLVLECW